MAEEADLLAADLAGEVHLIEGGGVQGRWAEQTHLHQGLSGAGAATMAIRSIGAQTRARIASRSSGSAGLGAVGAPGSLSWADTV